MRDWLSNSRIDIQTYFNDSIDVHHIFPVAWCEKNGISRDQYNCIINKTPLSSGTNKFVKGEAPSRYIERILQRIVVSREELDSILTSHQLNSELLRNDDFIGFMNARKELILRMIEVATGKSIPRGEEFAEEGLYIPDDSNDDIEDDVTM